MTIYSGPQQKQGAGKPYNYMGTPALILYIGVPRAVTALSRQARRGRLALSEAF